MIWAGLEHPKFPDTILLFWTVPKRGWRKVHFYFTATSQGWALCHVHHRCWSKEQLLNVLRKSRNISHGEILKLYTLKEHTAVTGARRDAKERQREGQETVRREREHQVWMQVQNLSRCSELTVDWSLQLVSHRKGINQLQHSNNSSFLLPELLSQSSRFWVPFASPAWLSSSLSSNLVPDSSPCLLVCWCEWVACIHLLTYPSATLCHCCVQSSRHPSRMQNMKQKLELCGGLFVLAVTVVFINKCLLVD